MSEEEQVSKLYNEVTALQGKPFLYTSLVFLCVSGYAL